MTKEEKQAIQARITELQKQQMNMKAQNGQYYQAIFELSQEFAKLEARIEELRNIINPKGEEDE